MALLLTHKRWALVAVLGLFIAGGSSALAVISQNYSSISQSSIRAKNTLLALSDLEGALKDAETGQRGFLLTGNTAYLEPYLIGSKVAQADLAKLDLLIQDDDAVGINALEEIQLFTQLKLQELDTTIQLRRGSGLKAALPLVESNKGKAYMDVIRARSNRIRFTQETNLSTNATILNQIDNFRNGAVLIIGFSSLGIFWLLFNSFRAELRLRTQVATSQESEIIAKEEAVKRLRVASDLKERELSLRIHDWKSPVSTIQSSIELIEYYYSRNQLSEANFNKHYKRINSAIDTLINGYNDALLVAKAEAGKLDIERDLCNLVDVCIASISAVEGKAEKHHIKLYTHDKALLVSCDANLVQRALINLLENALKHTSSGEIAIELLRAKAEGKIYIRVADQGEGMPSKDLQRLFTAFERGSTEAKGTGLGLAVVNYCAEAHGGSVTVKSQQGLRLSHPESLLYSTVFTLSF